MSGPLKFGLIGHHIAYSKSADIFKAIIELNKLDGTFDLYDLAPDTLESGFRKIINNGVTGLSVTIPHKTNVISLLDELDSVSQSLQAVNSIAVRNSKLVGYNTDAFGFSVPLRQHAPNLKNGTALIFGSGGSAKAVLFALHKDFAISRFIILGRDLTKLSLFKTTMQSIMPHSTLEIELTEKFSKFSQTKFDVVVNCTPLGGWNHPDKLPLPDKFDWSSVRIFYDLNYNSDNRSIALAHSNGVSAINGSQMLVGQAIRSFELWTTQSADFQKVYSRVFGNNGVS